MRLVVFVAVAVTYAAGCVDTPRLQEPEIVSSHVEIKELGPGMIPKLDVLVVLDDSVAMLPYRERVATLAPILARRLGELTSRWFDVQIAVTGNAGQFRYLAGTDTAYLADAWAFDYTHHASYAGTLADALTNLTSTEVVSEVPSQPLEAMRLALERNALFVRDNAAFAVVIVSATDDASPLPSAEYTRWMQAFVGDTSGWARKPSVIVGIHPQPSPRFDEYYTSLAPAVPSIVAPIESGDYADVISRMEPRIPTHLGGAPCLENIADLDPTLAGFQHDCVMNVHIGDSLRSLPECDVAAPPTDRSIDAWAYAPAPACWELVQDRNNCHYASEHALRFRGYTRISHPAFRFECRSR